MPRSLSLCRILVFCAAAFAQHDAGRRPGEGPESGAALFRRQCSSCHGKGGEGGRAPSLTGRLHAGDTDADVIRVVSAGIPGTEMASYEARLGSEQIERIVAYLRSLKRAEAQSPGDAARGEAVFWGKGGCGNCHAAGARGNRIGPDLSRIGRQRSSGFLRESLVSPSAEIAPDYYSMTVVTSDGRTVRGIEKAIDEFTVVLQDFSGRVYSFDRAALRSAVRDKVSMMPDYGKTLASGELDDVLQYLSTLGTSGGER